MLYLAILSFFFETASAVFYTVGQPVLGRTDIRIGRPLPIQRFPSRIFPGNLLFPQINGPGRLFNRQVHVHVPLNGKQYEHSHAFPNVAHSHDRADSLSPLPLYPGAGMGWTIPSVWRDSNTWAVVDKVNPDSVLWDGDLPGHTVSDTDKILTRVFPDSVLPANVDIPIISPGLLPTSDKEKEPAVVKPLPDIGRVPLDGINSKVNETFNGKPDGSAKLNGTKDLTGNALVSCSNTGCPVGSVCVLLGFYICPVNIPDVYCQCKPGCRMDTKFISLGDTITVDACGNTCSCLNVYGAPQCSTKKCNDTVIPNNGTSDSRKPAGQTTFPQQKTPPGQDAFLPPVNTLDFTSSDTPDLNITTTNDNVQMNFPIIPIVKKDA